VVKCYLKHSFIFIAVSKLLYVYEESVFKKVVVLIDRWYQYSAYHQCIKRYLERKSTAEDTITYGVLKRVGSKADRLVGKVSGFFRRYTKSSVCFKLIFGFISEFKLSFNKLLATALVAFILGYGATAFLLQKLISVKVLALLITVSLIVVLLNTFRVTLKSWLKNSLFLKIFNYTFE
jgi:hypothetical protein